jgi:hypothetical protein
MYKIHEHRDLSFTVRDRNNDEIRLGTDTGDTILDLKRWLAKKSRGGHLQLKASGGYMLLQDQTSDILRFSLYSGGEELKDDQVIDSIEHPLVINMVDNYSNLVLTLQNMAGDQESIRGEELDLGNITNPGDVKLHISRNNILGVDSPPKYIVLIDNETLQPVSDIINTTHVHTIFTNDNTDKMLVGILTNLLRDSEILVSHLEQEESFMRNINHFYGYLEELNKLKGTGVNEGVLLDMIATCKKIISCAAERVRSGDEIMYLSLAGTLKKWHNPSIVMAIEKLDK